MTIRKQRLHRLIWLARIIVLLLSISILYRELYLKEKISELIDWLSGRGGGETQWRWFVAGCLLVVVNWGIETRKWQYLYRSQEVLMFPKAFASVLAGVFISFFTPNRVGEFAGRMLYVPARKKISAAVTAVVGSMAQLLCTLLGGITAAVIYFVYSATLNSTEQFILLISAAISVTVLIFIFLHIGYLKVILLKIKALKRFERQLEVFDALKRRELLLALYFSALRYGVFTFQYFLMMQAFQVDITAGQTFIALGLLYFVQSVIPTFAISELTIRGTTDVFFSAVLALDETGPGITLAAYSIWLVNILIPAMIGGLIILIKKPRDVDSLA